MMVSGVDGWDSVHARARNLFLLPNIQTNYDAHMTSCPVGTSGFFPGDKSSGVESSPQTSIQ
jgi:hypothetical protein